jgi:hypothetical protein
MRQCLIHIPKSLNLQDTLIFSNHLLDLPEVDEYVFDFGNLEWVEPFSMLYLSSEIQLIRERFSTKKFTAINHLSQSYAGHMGFFKAFGCDFGNIPGQAAGNTNYIPITIYNCELLRREAAKNYEQVGQFIENNASQAATLLTRSTSGEIYDALTYSIREIIRNVIEHSESQRFGFCAQYWPKKNKVELSVLDRGVGIKAGLSSNPHLDIQNDHEALNLSLMPGISGKAYKGARQANEGHWTNTGFGLYMTSRLCREGGSFFIASGKTSLLLSENNKENINAPFSGTALRLILNTNRINSLSDMLTQYRKDASEYNSNKISASAASMMLSRDFKKL